MQAKFLYWESWLPVLTLLFFAVGPSLAYAQHSLGGEVCSTDICYVKVTAAGFVPEKLIVRDGSTVVWKNIDSNTHMIAGGLNTKHSLFNSSLLLSGRDYAFVFNGGETGEYSYFDQSKSNMFGKITITPRIAESDVKEIAVDFADPNSGLIISISEGNNVTGVAVIPRLNELTIATNAHRDGMLNITLARELLDAQISGKDVPFQVLVDEKTATYKEKPTSTSQRTLVLDIPAGTKDVSIVGRQVSLVMLGYDGSQRALEQADKTIAGLRGKGIVMTDAEALLLNAHDSFSSGRYHFATSLANEASSLALSTKRTAQMANQAIEVAEVSINTTKYLGISVQETDDMLQRTKEMYGQGRYDEALSMAVQAKIAVANSTNQFYVVAGIAGVSVGWTLIYLRQRRKYASRREVMGGSITITDHASIPVAESQKDLASPPPIDFLEPVFAGKPHIRDGDKEVLRYMMERNGEALLADIRNRFLLPKSSAWRLVKRLEREELVDIIKFGNQNLIRCRVGRLG
jgi:plastocyanin